MGDTSSEQYFIRRNGAVKGPYSLAKVESGLASGKLRDSDKIAASESGPWETLGRWNRNATTGEDDDSDDDLMGQPYDDETYLDDLTRLVQSAKPVVRQEATTSKVDIARPSLRQRIEESGVEVDWDVLLGNLKKLALILGGVAAVGLTIWFGIPLASRAVQDTIQQVNEFQEAVAQVEAIQPAVEPADKSFFALPSSTPGKRNFKVKVFIKLESGESQKLGEAIIHFCRQEVMIESMRSFKQARTKQQIESVEQSRRYFKNHEDTVVVQTDADGVAKVEIPGGSWSYWCEARAGIDGILCVWLGDVPDKVAGNELLLNTHTSSALITEDVMKNKVYSSLGSDKDGTVAIHEILVEMLTWVHFSSDKNNPRAIRRTTPNMW